jgi:hypothetical protein
VIDTHGARSSQLDLVIATDAHPQWFEPDSPSFFLMEGIAGVGEVKSTLTSQDLDAALQNVRNFRRLKPRWPHHMDIVGARDDLRRYLASPPYFLFAYEADMSMDSIAERFLTVVDGPRELESLDALVVLGKGYVVNLGFGERAFQTVGPDGVALEGYNWDDRSESFGMLLSWLPLALVAPTIPTPILAPYLLADLAGLSRPSAG